MPAVVESRENCEARVKAHKNHGRIVRRELSTITVSCGGRSHLTVGGRVHGDALLGLSAQLWCFVHFSLHYQPLCARGHGGHCLQVPGGSLPHRSGRALTAFCLLTAEMKAPKRRQPFVPFALRNHTGCTLWFATLTTTPTR